jgi:hypothetical protein
MTSIAARSACDGTLLYSGLRTKLQDEHDTSGDERDGKTGAQRAA